MIHFRVGLGRVCAQPRTDLPKLGGKTLNPLLTARVIGLDGSNHQQVADELVGVTDLRRRQEKLISGENLIGFYEISPDSVKISSDSMRFC